MLLFCASGTLPAQGIPADSLRIQRLAALGRLWGTIKYFHPWFLARDVPWDSALVAAIPRVRAALDTREYGAAVGKMLDVVNDPYTRIAEAPKPSTNAGAAAATAARTDVQTRWSVDSTLIISIPCCFSENSDALRDAIRLVERAPRIVFDLRGPRPAILGEANDEFGGEFGVDLDTRLVNGAIAGPTVRRRMYQGYRSSGADGSTATLDVAGGIFRGRAGNTAQRTAFLVYAHSDLPDVALALQNAGQGVIVLDDAVGDRLPTTRLLSIPLGEGVTAEVRVAETLGRPDGMPGPDTTVRRTQATDEPLAAALLLVRHADRPVTRVTGTELAIVPRADSAYPDMHYPTLPYRLLAVFRYWNAIRYFYPSAMPPATRWDDQLPSSIRRLEAARDSIQYRLGLAALSASLRDGHAQTPWVSSFVTGEAGPRVTLLFVEGRPVVTGVMRDSATVASGIAVGDVIMRVDGEDVSERIARIETLMPGTSRPGEPAGPPLNRLLFGPRGSSVRVTIERADGTQRELALPRVMPPCLPNNCSERTGPALRFFGPEVGYADLARITESMVDSLFETFRNTRAIIFDGRGRNAGSPPAIASRLAEQRLVVGSRSVRPLVNSPDASQRTMLERAGSNIDSVSGWRYRGKTVLLINDRAVSNAEQVPIFFSSANSTTLIGSPTAGAIGGLTFVAVPGGLTMSFPGSEERLPDGRVIHRVGVPPDILVRPTIAGIRAGRDEVLERALAYLREGR